jgi:hypothetical protein
VDAASAFSPYEGLLRAAGLEFLEKTTYKK